MRIFKFLIVLIFFILGLTITSQVFAGNPPDASKSTLTSTEVKADGTTQSTVTITLHDASDVALTTDTVTPSSPGNPTIIFSPSSAALDSSGIATFSATSTNAGTFKITVDDETTVTTLSDLGTITFDVDPGVPPPGLSQPSSCADIAPVSAPDLYQVSPGKAEATLYFAPPNADYDGFTISYGLSSSADNYSVHIARVQTNGAIKYVVGALTENIYYFKVRATKGCAAGPWSQVVSSQNLSNLKTLPETGPNNLLLFGGFGGAVILILGISLFFVL